MRIDQRLNIVFTLDTASGTLYVHSAPISRDIFERHYLVLGKTFARIMAEGLSIVQGPNMAALLLRDIARETVVPGRAGSALDGPDGVERTLLPEIRRLTNVAVPTANGYESRPYDVAVRSGLIDADDAADVENVLVFFTCASWGMRGAPAAATRSLLDGMRLLWAVETTSSNCTEHCASLTTSTQPEPSTPETSLVPSSTTLPSPPRPNGSTVIPI